MSAPAPSPSASTRIGHDERHAAIAALDEHLAAGRLDAEEYGERMAAASLARTRDELDPLFDDLPQPRPFPPTTPVWAPPVPPPPLQRWYDPRSGLWLPAGTELAGVGRRIGAFFLGIVLFLVTLGIGYAIWGLAVWSRGQTPALQVLRMRAYRPSTGRAAGFGWMALREVLGRLVEQAGGGLVALLSFVLFCSQKQHRALHDLIAGTVVLHELR